LANYKRARASLGCTTPLELLWREAAAGPRVYGDRAPKDQKVGHGSQKSKKKEKSSHPDHLYRVCSRGTNRASVKRVGQRFKSELPNGAPTFWCGLLEAQPNPFLPERHIPAPRADARPRGAMQGRPAMTPAPCPLIRPSEAMWAPVRHRIVTSELAIGPAPGSGGASFAFGVSDALPCAAVEASASPRNAERPGRVGADRRCQIDRLAVLPRS
jgi:hypothetical protein